MYHLLEWTKNVTEKGDAAVGDVALVMSLVTTPQGKRPFDKVLQLFPEKDEDTRIVNIIMNRNGYLWPIRFFICPLDVLENNNIVNKQPLEKMDEESILEGADVETASVHY